MGFKGYDEKREEVFEIKGDNPNSDKEVLSGYSQLNLNKSVIANPKIRYKDLIMQADLYQAGEELSLHIYCPRCRHASWIKSSNKKMHWDKDRNTISVEPFKCAWEIDEDIIGGGRQFGMSLCNLSLVIDNGVAREV